MSDLDANRDECTTPLNPTPLNPTPAPPPAATLSAWVRDLRSLPTLDECVHCGLCLGSCPTYEVFGREVESPRGRIAAFRNLADGKPWTPAVAEGLEDCLVCRACESACPSGISMEAMMSGYRAAARSEAPRLRDRLEAWFLREIIPRPEAVRALTALLRVTRPALWMLGLEVPRASRLRRRSYHIEQPKKPRGRVRIFRGCVSDAWFRDVTQAAIRVLTRNGWYVDLPHSGCCGALHRHAGEVEQAKRLGKAAAAALDSDDIDYVISDTAGCTAALLEPLSSDFHSVTTKAKVVDTMGLLHREGFIAPSSPLEGEWRVAPPCHHRHGELDEEPTRAVLGAALANGYRELPGPDHCCGAAGLYMVRRPSVSRRVGAASLERYETVAGSTDAPVGIISGNAGCLMRWETLLEERGVEAIHPVVALDRAYGAR